MLEIMAHASLTERFERVQFDHFSVTKINEMCKPNNVYDSLQSAISIAITYCI